MLHVNKMGWFAIGSIGVIAAARLFGKKADAWPVESDFTPAELNGMLSCVRDGNLHAFKAIYLHKIPDATTKEISQALTRFTDYLK